LRAVEEKLTLNKLVARAIMHELERGRQPKETKGASVARKKKELQNR